MWNKNSNSAVKGFFGLLAAWLFVAASYVVASETPHEVVEEVTGQMVEVIVEHQPTFKDDPDSFYQALDALLNDAVDFDWIAYNVMGPYRKQATAEQRERFSVKFRRDLIKTYGGGLISFGDQKIVVLPPEGDIEGKRTVRVDQEIHGAEGVFPLHYTMGLNRQGEWKVTNVIINGVNLGKTFRNQFLQRAQKYNGDVDLVIANWSSSGSLETSAEGSDA